MAERWLGLLRKKIIALPDGLGEGMSGVVNTERVWAETIAFFVDMSNVCTMTSVVGGSTPHELLYSKAPAIDCLNPFCTTGYVRVNSR